MIPATINSLMVENYKKLRDHLLKLTASAGLTVESTVRDFKARLSPEEWSVVEQRLTASNYTEESTILELLAAIQSADAPAEDD